jgi:hypothetical protein
MSTHERFTPGTEVAVGSERGFGQVFAGFFTLVAVLPLFKGGEPRLWALGVAAVFLVLAYAAPKALRPLNLLWFKFGMVLHHVVTPVVMGLLFFAVVTPVGVLMRATGKDPMRLKRDPAARSYWIVREPPGPAPDSMKNQF